MDRDGGRLCDTFDGEYSTGIALLGKNGGCTLYLNAGASLTCTESTSTSLFVGALSDGQLLLNGQGAKVSVSQGGVVVGNTGRTGWLSLMGGAVAEFTGSSETLASTIFGVGSGGSGTGVVDGDGSVMDIKRGGLEIGRAATGRVDATSGGKIMVDKAPDVSALLVGTEPAGYGLLVVSGQGSETTISSGGLEIGRKGIGRVDVMGSGKLSIPGEQNRCLIMGGETSGPGIFAVQGDYEQTAASTMRCTIAGATPGTEYSQLTANAVTLDGKIIIEFQHGFAPSNGQTFDLIDTATGVTLAPTLRAELRNLAPGFQYTLEVVGGKYRLTALSDAVPAPVYRCTLDHVPGLFLRVEYTGILQSSTDLNHWTDVTGAPGTSHQIPAEDLVGQEFFQVRSIP